MNRNFERLNELVSLHHPDDERSRFHRFWEYFSDIPERVKAFAAIEDELSSLDQEAWSFIKNEAKDLIIKPNSQRGWNQLFEKLNEAKGYCFLKSIGCSKISFIPRATKNNIETPDLKGWKNGSLLLAEVKTINISDELVSARENGSVMLAHNTLTHGLENKLNSTFIKAASQLNSYSQLAGTTKYIYLVATYDDEIDYRNELNAQARELFKNMSMSIIRLVIHDE